MLQFLDGVKDLINGLTNRRNPLNTNTLDDSGALTDQTKRAAFKIGVHNKALRLKTGHALKNTIQFDSTADKEFYDERLAPHVKKAVIGMLNYGRGVIVIHAKGDDVTKPLGKVQDPARLKFTSFYGDMVTIGGVEMDLNGDYFKPLYYNIRGQSFHCSRVIDFTYVEPSEYEAPTYRYGGISETELVYSQLLNDGIVERASATIIEKASTFIYKIAGFKDALRAKKEKELIKYFERMESVRNIMGAVLLDSEDEATAVNQQLTNLDSVNDMSLRRLAMVYGIPLPYLIGENVKGMNAVGENERQIFQDMIEALQSDYILRPLKALCTICTLGPIAFKENQGETPVARVTYEGLVLDNATKLYALGEDHTRYLNDKGIMPRNDWDDFFNETD